MLTRWQSWPWTVQVALVAWFALLGGVGLRVALSSPRSGTVVPIYLNAGERWKTSGNLYAPAPPLDVYRHPPIVAASLVPLSYLPDRMAGLVWRGICAAVFLAGMVRFARQFLTDWSLKQLGWWLGLAAWIALPSVNNGQVNLLLAGAGLHMFVALRVGRLWEATLWCGFAGWWKLYPFAFGMLAVLIVPRGLSLKLVLVGFAGFLLPFVLQSPSYVAEQYRDYIGYLGMDDRTYAQLDRVPRDWTVIPRMWLGIVPTPTVTKIVSLMAAGLTAGVVIRLIRMRTGLDQPLMAAWILGSIWMTVFGPATESNTYAILAAVASYIVVDPTPRSRLATILSRVGYGLLWITVLRGLFPADWKFQVLGPQPLGALALAAAAVLTWRARLAIPVSTPAVWIDFGRVSPPVRLLVPPPPVPTPGDPQPTVFP